MQNEFLRKIAVNGNVWVAMKDDTALSFTRDNDVVALPVWTSHDQVVAFLDYASSTIDCAPVEVPLISFTNSWLSDQKFDEIIAAPDGTTRNDLVFSKSEFVMGVSQ